MNGVQNTAATGFEKVVFESVIDTFAGGVTLDVTGTAGSIVEAGTLVGPKDPSTGLAKIVTVTGTGGSATFSPTPFGFTHGTIPIDNNPVAGVVIEGVVRVASLPQAVQDAIAALKPLLPKITFV